MLAEVLISLPSISRRAQGIEHALGQLADGVQLSRPGSKMANSSPPSGPRVLATHHLAQAPGDMADEFVTGGVAERVVDLFVPASRRRTSWNAL